MPFLRSPAFDLGWFVVPGLLAALLGLAIGLLSPEPPASESLLLWIGGVLLVDVAHVYASLYRTYLGRVSLADARHCGDIELTGCRQAVRAFFNAFRQSPVGQIVATGSC